MTIGPFKSIRYEAGVDLEQVTCPPYDVIAPEERERLAEKHPLNFVRLILPPPLQDESAERYSLAAKLWSTWRTEGTLRSSEEPQLFLYRSSFELDGRRLQTTGLVCSLELASFGNGVLPHEATMRGPKEDRLLNMRATGANLEPLWFVASRPMEGFGRLAGSTMARPPIAELRDEDGVSHSLWEIFADAHEGFVAAAADVDVVIADGHHRYETALTYQAERREASGPGPWDSTLALISDLEFQPPALRAIHRKAANISIEAISERSRLTPHTGSVEDLLAQVNDREATIGLVAPSKTFTLEAEGELDVEFLSSILQDLGAQIEFVHDTLGMTESLHDDEVVFVLKPVPLDAVVRRARKGRPMPPKSTLFWPKPRSGLVMRNLV